MYERKATRLGCQSAARTLILATAAMVLATGSADGQIIKSQNSVIRRISSANEKLELTVNSSRILTLEKRIPRVQVNNPELLAVTPLSATQVQIAAKKAGVTAINLWDEDGNIHAVDVYIYGDVRELEHALKTQFPNSSIRVYRYSSALVLTGFIDRPDFVNPIVELAQDYSPKVINNISVGGVQQVLLKVKICEISRTKIRQMGSDFSALSSGGGFLTNGVGGLIANTTNGAPGAIQTITDTGGQSVEFGIVNGGDAFFGVLDLLQQHSLAKILAEPNIVAVSGRPAQFNEGGEIPIIVPQSLGTASVEYKPFGTQVDFLPIVLGNGNIRLEVRPRISELDNSNSVTLQSIQIPALTVREVDTAVEMKAGQTFALAGLIQRRTESVNRGVPYLSDLPVLGVPFRHVSEEVNEIELLILVTPEFVDAMDCHEVPPCYPGSGTISPNNCELYWGGHLEVPNRCNGCGQCGCIPTHGHEPCCPNGNCSQCNQGGGYGSAYGAAYGDGSHQYDSAVPAGEQYLPMPSAPTPAGMEDVPAGPAVLPDPVHGELTMPPQSEANQSSPDSGPAFGLTPDGVGGHYPVARKPTYQRHASRPYNPSRPAASSATPDSATGLIGPVGYDLE